MLCCQDQEVTQEAVKIQRAKRCITDSQPKSTHAEVCLEEQSTGDVQQGSTSLTQSLTCIWWLAGVPDENATVIGGAGEDVVIDGADGQTVDGVDVQEHIKSFSPVPRDNQAITASTLLKKSIQPM